MRRAPWSLLLVPPIVVMGCADLIGIGDLPGLPDGGPDAKADTTTPAEASTHDAPRSDTGKSGDAGSGEAGLLTLSVAPTGVHLVRGTSANVAVTRAGPASTVAVTVTGRPSGVTAGPLTIPSSATMGTLTLTSTAGATLGPASVSIQGGGSTAPFDLVVADPTGTYDTTFGTGGGVVTYVPNGATNADATTVALLDDGSFVAGGSGNGWALVHVLSNGTIDTTFKPTLPSVGYVTSVARGPTSGPFAGTLFVSGASQNCGLTVNQATIYIMNETGTPYSAFNGDGRWCQGVMGHTAGTQAVGAGGSTSGDVYIGVNESGTGAQPYLLHFAQNGDPATSWNQTTLAAAISLIGVAVDPSDDLIVTGAYAPQQFFAQRYTPASTGGADPTFVGGTGAFGAASAILYAQTSALDPDSGVYVGGSGSASGELPVLGHVTPAGKVDFGDAGWVSQTMTIPENAGYFGLATQGDGRLIGVGYGNDSTGSWPFVARMTPGGLLDPTFNADAGSSTGYYTMHSTTGINYGAVAVAPPPDGRIVIVGFEPGSGMYFVRIWP
jgi:hypothetical protein